MAISELHQEFAVSSVRRNSGCRQLPGWLLGYDAGRGQAQAYFHDKWGTRLYANREALYRFG